MHDVWPFVEARKSGALNKVSGGKTELEEMNQSDAAS